MVGQVQPDTLHRTCGMSAAGTVRHHLQAAKRDPGSLGLMVLELLRVNHTLVFCS